MKELRDLEKCYLILAKEKPLEVMTSLSITQAILIAAISKDESDLLDGISLANKCLREASCEIFTEKKKAVG